MYLKEIKTYGFKSFADKINIELGRNINAIVGPNGSGKSNVVDAVRFVLGEQSIKSLRGDSNMVDVIFSGSASRKPLSSASVTLVFDNTDHVIPINYDEVSIKRVIYKTGENEYYINNEKVRLKDISDLLSDTGSNKENFNIISQGKIDEVLLAKPIDRRVMFESAAGVLKYKKRKEEAIRKLDRTNENIKRIEDIITEISTSLEPLKEQSIKAKRYLELKEELQDVEISLMISDIEKLNFEYEELKELKEKLNDEIIRVNKENLVQDVDLISHKEKLKEIDLKIIDLDKDIYELNNKYNDSKTELNLLRERQKYDLSEEKVNVNIIKLNEKKLTTEQAIKSLQNEIELKDKDKEIIKNKLTDNIKKYNEFKSKYNDFITELNKYQRLKTDIKYQKDSLERSIEESNTLPLSIRKIINNASLKGIHNVIGKLIEVDNPYMTAIEISLGASTNYLVVETSNNAKECVNYLKDNNIGRATFYPLDSIKPRMIDRETLNIIDNDTDYVDIASNLVKYDKTYENIIMNLLGNVLITKNITSAVELSKKINKRYKIVTLDGQVINVGGSITGGNVILKGNAIKEKYELAELLQKENKINNNINEIELRLDELDKQVKTIDEIILSSRKDLSLIEDNINNKKDVITKTKEILNSIEIELNSYQNTESEEELLLNRSYQLKNELEDHLKEKELLIKEKNDLSEMIERIEEENKKVNSYVNKKEKDLNDANIKYAKIEVNLDHLLNNLTEEYNMTFEGAKEKYHIEIDESIAREKVNSMKNELNSLGNVNLGSIEEFERINTRHEFLSSQKDDLLKAENTLLEIINEMDEIMKEKFLETFNEIKTEFQNVFKTLFKGGNANLILTDPNNLLETGIDIEACPPGKSLRHLSLLSGGEKTFTAISLLFAILNVRPVPFAILDEVEAALDEVNVVNFGEYLKKYHDKTQFIVVTHKKKTMEYADILYGITMQESGVSKLVSVKLKEM